MLVVFVFVQSAAADEVPVRMVERAAAPALAEGAVLEDEIIDVAVWEEGDMLLAAGRREIRLLGLPDFEVIASAKPRGKPVNCGFLRESSPGNKIFFITASVGRDINTYFYEFDGKKIKRIGYDSSSYYRSIDGNLLTQSVGAGLPYQGAVRPSAFDGTRTRPGDPLSLPAPGRIHDFIRARFWSSDVDGIVRIDADDGRIALFRPDADGWEEIWESEEGGYGGSVTKIKGVDQEQPVERKQGLLAANLDDDPEFEFLAVHNRAAGSFDQLFGRAYDKSRIRAFDVSGRRAAMIWETDTLNGTVPNIARWRDRLIIPLVDPSGRRTRFYLNPLKVDL